MLVVGLTGGIGSGKTLVSDHLASLGAAVIDTDVISRKVCEPGQPGATAIRAHFGPSVFGPDGTLNRMALRKIVFSEESSRRELEHILHPLIRAQLASELTAVPDSTAYALLAVPLLVESPAIRAMCNRILVVDCSELRQIERVISRNALTASEVEKIIAAQSTRSERLSIANDVITNDGSLEALGAQADAIHASYMALSAEMRRNSQTINCQTRPNGTKSGDSETLAQSPS